MLKKRYRTDTKRTEVLDIMGATGKILVEDARHIDENFLLFIDPEETEPYIIITDPPGPTPTELLQEDNASLWYENMVQSAKVEANETEVAGLWYSLMMGGI